MGSVPAEADKEARAMVMDWFERHFMRHPEAAEIIIKELADALSRRQVVPREPTDVMIRAGVEYYGKNRRGWSVSELWTAMHDAFTKGGS